MDERGRPRVAAVRLPSSLLTCRATTRPDNDQAMHATASRDKGDRPLVLQELQGRAGECGGPEVMVAAATQVSRLCRPVQRSADLAKILQR